MERQMDSKEVINMVDQKEKEKIRKMEDGVSNTEKKRWIVKELKKVSFLAGPMAVVTVSMYLLLAVALIMAGHLGELQLSGVAIATSFANTTGFSVLLGLSGALETLCGQAYGAGQYQKLGSYTYCGLISLILVCIPLFILWIFTDKLLISAGIDPHISRVAGKYTITLIPALFGYAVHQCLLRYYQTQSLVLPILISSCVSIVIHVPLYWVLVFKWKFGYIGGAIATGFSRWLNVVLLAFHMRSSSSCEKTRMLCFKEIFSSISQFWRFAIPSALMVCLQWCAFEVLTLLAGRLPNSKLQTSVLSICLTVSSIHYCVQCGLSAAASTRVSNELGSGNPKAARSVVCIVLSVSFTEAVIVSIVLFSCRRFLGYAFSNNKEVVNYVAKLSPILCLSITLDSLLSVLSGAIRGCGRQRIGAFMNLGMFYFVGIPLAVVLCFVVNLKIKGLWIGALTGTALLTATLGTITALTNWQQQAIKAKERISKKQIQHTVDGIET